MSLYESAYGSRGYIAFISSHHAVDLARYQPVMRVAHVGSVRNTLVPCRGLIGYSLIPDRFGVTVLRKRLVKCYRVMEVRVGGSRCTIIVVLQTIKRTQFVREGTLEVATCFERADRKLERNVECCMPSSVDEVWKDGTG